LELLDPFFGTFGPLFDPPVLTLLDLFLTVLTLLTVLGVGFDGFDPFLTVLGGFDRGRHLFLIPKTVTLWPTNSRF